MPWLKGAVPGLSSRTPGFGPKVAHVGFAVDKVAMGQVLLPLVRFPLSIPIQYSVITDSHTHTHITGACNLSI